MLMADRLEALLPKAGVRLQLVAASLMWLIGSGFLLYRGTLYVRASWTVLALAIGLALGVFKSQVLLDRVSRKAVARIHARGRGQILGFFSLQSWLLIGLMMGGGITLRHIFVHPGVLGAGILGAIYIGVGTALLLSDRVFWQAVFAQPASAAEDVPQHDEARDA
jgi:hypothetical protein